MKLQAVSSAAGGAAGEEPEEENMATMAKAVLQAAKKKVVSQVSNLSQVTVVNMRLQVQQESYDRLNCIRSFRSFVSASCCDPQVQKKVFIENTVPLIISLKSLLEQKRSPVLRDLMAYLQVRHAASLRTHFYELRLIGVQRDDMRDDT